MDAASGHGSLPRGYPAQYQQELVLCDGRTVLIRPILPSDAPELADAIKTADPDTLRSRFLGGAPRITPELLAHLTVVDYVRRFALVALDTATGHGVAIARYEQIGEDEDVAEIAVAVRPPGGVPGWRPYSSFCSPRRRRSAAFTPSAPPTSPTTGPAPPWSRMLASWAHRSSSRDSPSSHSH